MTKKTTLKWRLGKLPTSNEVIDLVQTKVITQEEAREILFSNSEEDTESLKSEIKFLRELINKLSNQSTIVEKIRYIERPYYNYPWWGQYSTYCSSINTVGSALNQQANTIYGGVAGSSTIAGSNYSVTNGTSTLASAQSNLSAASNFTDIKTF